jgi:hypothetical protein
MTAMVSCVKLLAEPSPPPGPCDAKAAPAQTMLVAAEVAAMNIPIFLDDAMTISCDEWKLQKIRIPAYPGFEDDR